MGTGRRTSSGSAGGDYIVYMALVEGKWQIVRASVKDLSKTVLAEGRQLGWGQANLDVVPLYGLHWGPGRHRDLELLNVRTGEIKTVLTADRVAGEHAEFVATRLGVRRREGEEEKRRGGEEERGVPRHGQDARATEEGAGGAAPRVGFFPAAQPGWEEGCFLSCLCRGMGSSGRRRPARARGCLCMDAESGRCLGMNVQWGHPAWCADSRRIVDLHFPDWPGTGKGRVGIIDADREMAVELVLSADEKVDDASSLRASEGTKPRASSTENEARTHRLLTKRDASSTVGLPVPLGGSHPSVSPDGRGVGDGSAEEGVSAAGRGCWTIMLADPEDGRNFILHVAPAEGDGTTSWRTAHTASGV